MLLALSGGTQCQAGSLDLLYRFCEQPQCRDGGTPSGRLMLDQHGNLYGTTIKGGAHDKGTVFQLSPDGTETVLYSFCAQPDCSDGLSPRGGLIADAAGNLYGTTSNGGTGNRFCGNLLGPALGCGTVFKLTPGGVETVLHSFCSDANCADGAFPGPNLIIDADGNLYSTSTRGGAFGSGIVFRLAPDGTETILYSFCSLPNCADGQYPWGGLARDQVGNLYGTTGSGGGPQSAGMVFKVTPQGQESVLYRFCSLPNCIDGLTPSGGLVADAAGNLYGITQSGGDTSRPSPNSRGFGTVFMVTPSGSERVRFSFCHTGGCPAGSLPDGGLIRDTAGNLYGATSFDGGRRNSGAVYALIR